MNIESSALFAFGAMIFWGVGDFLIQRTVKKIGDFESVAWLGLVASIVML